MLKAYKYRIYPTKEQEKLMAKHFGCCRLVYNLALETKIYAYKHFGVSRSVYDLCYELPDLKKEFDWLKEVDSQALQASIKNIDNAFKKFFKGSGYPKFKNKHSRQSFQCPNNTRKIDFEKGLLTIPKIKNIPIVLDRVFIGKIKTITISKTPTGKHFASILVECEKVIPVKKPILPETTIGIDLGLKHFLITSEGVTVDNPRNLRNAMGRLKVLQRRASRKVKGSANRKKANLRVAILHEKITGKRLDFIHKVTSKLVNDNQVDTFFMEDLNVKGMISNHKLAQAISDVSWSKFKEILKYKCEWNGKNLITIGRFEPSSKTCSGCGHKKDELLLSERVFVCEVCAKVIDRDFNAALNIKNFGLKNSGMGNPGEPVEVCSVEQPVKQELSCF